MSHLHESHNLQSHSKIATGKIILNPTLLVKSLTFYIQTLMYTELSALLSAPAVSSKHIPASLYQLASTCVGSQVQYQARSNTFCLNKSSY